MSVSVDGFIADREGAFGWTALARSSFVPPLRLQPRTVATSVRASVRRLGVSD
jgi:hypothetical protein